MGPGSGPGLGPGPLFRPSGTTVEGVGNSRGWGRTAAGPGPLPCCVIRLPGVGAVSRGLPWELRKRGCQGLTAKERFLAINSYCCPSAQHVTGRGQALGVVSEVLGEVFCVCGWWGSPVPWVSVPPAVPTHLTAAVWVGSSHRPYFCFINRAPACTGLHPGGGAAHLGNGKCRGMMQPLLRMLSFHLRQ